jgi:hypothetical protein
VDIEKVEAVEDTVVVDSMAGIVELVGVVGIVELVDMMAVVGAVGLALTAPIGHRLHHYQFASGSHRYCSAKSTTL